MRVCVVSVCMSGTLVFVCAHMQAFVGVDVRMYSMTYARCMMYDVCDSTHSPDQTVSPGYWCGYWWTSKGIDWFYCEYTFINMELQSHNTQPLFGIDILYFVYKIFHAHPLHK